ncbi:hypothetical protein Lfu02_15470 [Longispora fulva]|nr:hypothetical protein Lfu02_15470 [Longispora fulva]
MTRHGHLLTVMAHADDAELWAGGTLCRHAHLGWRTSIAVPASDPVRDGEAAAGADVLGARLHLLPDMTIATVAALLAELRPDVVITHPADDVHPDHRHASGVVLGALPEVVIATGRPGRVYTCDSYNNLDQHGRPLDLPVVIDTTDYHHTKIKALLAHESQPIAEHFGPMAETLGRLHGHRIGTGFGEGFRPVPVLGRIPATDTL